MPTELKLHLAPMEGVVDVHLRRLITDCGGYDYCVTEFIRVSDRIPPKHVIHRYCPELAHNNSLTHAGTPVAIQFLGGNASMLAESAVRAVELGAPIIDLNFGCPAKTVNRHDGGASLLQYPARIHAICQAVRQAVPETIPVTAKMRLGYLDAELMLDNALAVNDAGLQRLAIHGRTKIQGYKPPADWEAIALIKEATTIPLVANGDINSVDDFWRCHNIIGCKHYMIGRGALRQPDLAYQIKASVNDQPVVAQTWVQLLPNIITFFNHCIDHAPAHKYAISRLKQWLRFLAENYAEARELFDCIKRQTTIQTIHQTLSVGLGDAC